MVLSCRVIRRALYYRFPRIFNGDTSEYDYLNKHVFFTGEEIIFIFVHLHARVHYITEKLFIVKYFS